jgi:methylglyoxal synthase
MHGETVKFSVHVVRIAKLHNIPIKHSYPHIRNINALIRVVTVFSLSLPPALTELCNLPKERFYFFL